jgi:CO dehydrogenase maturation factor
MPDLLGTPVKKTVGDVCCNLLDRMSQLPPDFNKKSHLESQLFEVLYEGDSFDLLVMGALEREGCFCYINTALTSILDNYIQNYEYTLMDMPAGLEHIARRTDRNVDHLYVITDASKMGLLTALRIKQLSQKLKIQFRKIYLVANRVAESALEIVRQYAENNGLNLVGHIPDDPLVQEYNLVGKSLLDLPNESSAYKAVREIITNAIL